MLANSSSNDHINQRAGETPKCINVVLSLASLTIESLDAESLLTAISPASLIPLTILRLH